MWMNLTIFYSTTCFEILKQVDTFFLSFKLSTLSKQNCNEFFKHCTMEDLFQKCFAVFLPWGNEFICKYFSETAYLKKVLLRKSTNIPSCSHCSRAENSSLEKLRYLSFISNLSWIFRKQIPRDCLLLPSPFPQYRYFLYTPLTSRFRKYTKNLPQFRTLTVVRQRQQLSPYWKQTVRLTSPSFSEGWGPFNHPPTSAPQRFSGTQRFAIRSPAWPLKRYQASGSVKDSLSLCDWSTVSKAAVLSGSESNLWFFALHGSDSETEKKTKQNKKVRLSLLCPEHFSFLNNWNFEESLILPLDSFSTFYDHS